MKLKHVDLYTDGACSQNGTWVGGYGIVLIYNGHKKEMSGVSKETTNNKMELTAVIEGLKAIKEKVDVTIYTDSAYVLNAFEKDWLSTWQQNGWKNAQNKDVSNKDLWEELFNLTKKHIVHWIKVKGHSDNENNNRCDFLATSEIKKYIQNLQQEGNN